MADQSFLQRGLTGFRDTMRNVGQSVGRAATGAAKKAKAQMGAVKKSAGFSDVDAFGADEDEQNRKRRAARFFGDDEPSFVGVPTTNPKRDLSTVSPEFRAQVSSGLAGANSQTSGSTLVDRGGGGGDAGNW